MENIPQNQKQHKNNEMSQDGGPILVSPKITELKGIKWMPFFAILLALAGAYFSLAKYQSWWPFNFALPASNTSEIDTNNQMDANAPIDVRGNFIFILPNYADNSEQILVSDVAGKNPTLLKTLQFSVYEDIHNRFPSPKGTYYVHHTPTKDSVYDLNGTEIFILPTKFEFGGTVNEFGDILRWSEDERYLASVISDTARIDDTVIVYDIKKGKEIFRKKLEYLKESSSDLVNGVVVTDPIKTQIKVVWEHNALYSFDEAGIYKITNFDSVPSVMFIPTPSPCHGIAPRGNNEFLCHTELSTTFSYAKHPAETPYTGRIFKYVLTGNKLSEPQFITGPLAGEYDADLFFLDDSYLLFIPELGGTTLVDIKTGKTADIYEGPPINVTSRSIQIFTDALKGDRGQSAIDLPIRYLGNK